MTNEHTEASMTQELRRLAEAATVGIWKASGFDVNSKEHGWATIANTELDYDGMAENAAYIAAANPAAILSLLDRLEKAEKDAERYRWLRRKVCVIGKSRFCGEDVGLPMFDFVNLPDVVDIVCRDAAATLDNSIDAAMGEK